MSRVQTSGKFTVLFRSRQRETVLRWMDSFDPEPLWKLGPVRVERLDERGERWVAVAIFSTQSVRARALKAS